MAVLLSMGLRNHVLSLGSIKNALQGAILKVFSGAVPADANAAESGALLISYTDGGGPWTPETLSTATVTLTSGVAGQITQITLAGGATLLSNPVQFNASLLQTALDLAAEINNAQPPNARYWAQANNVTVTIYAVPGTGASPNGTGVSPTLVTMTASATSFAGGVDAVNGIKFGYASAGILSKISSQLLQGTIVTSGTAAYWRLYTEAGDTGAQDVVARYRRAQGLVATSAETLVIPNTSLVLGSGQRVGSFQISD